MNRIAVLGEGVTGKAVRETLARVDGYELVALDQADLAVASPGIPPKDYPETTIPIISEIEFAYRLMHRPDSSYRPKLVGITGTNGKSTVTALLAHMMDIPALGNFGTPLVTLVDSPTAPEWLVVELSSYQLERCFDFRPDIAVILNLAPDHFSRHDSMLGYATEKAKIFQSQLAEDVLFFNRDITLIRPLADESKGQVVFFSDQDDFSSIDLPAKMVGGHNRVNVWIATQLSERMGLPTATAQSKLKTFRGLPHRIEWVASVGGRSFFNDSKSTNPDATEKAVSSFEENQVHVIICGVDKGLDLVGLVDYLNDRVVSVTVFGDIAGRFMTTVKSQNVSVPVTEVLHLRDALKAAYSASSTGDVILFSPACSSFDQFANFESRGDQFRAVVRDLESSEVSV